MVPPLGPLYPLGGGGGPCSNQALSPGKPVCFNHMTTEYIYGQEAGIQPCQLKFYLVQAEAL